MTAYGERFFARVRSFDIECPDCGVVYVVRSEDETAVFDERTSMFRCQCCDCVLQLGLFAWYASTAVLDFTRDQRPMPSQERWIRSLSVGWLASRVADQSDAVRRSAELEAIS
jgi:hypothetical protein